MSVRDTAVAVICAAWLALVPGCPGADEPLVIVLDGESDVDECADLCVEVTATRGGGVVAGAGVRVAVDEGELMPAGETDAEGLALACVDGGRVGPGDHEVRIRVDLGQESAEDGVAVRVHPFGFAWGLIKDASAPEPPPVPVIERYEENPVFEAGPVDSWEGFTVMMPSVVAWDGGYLMLYQGRSADGDYEIGGAWSEDGMAWSRLSDDPVVDTGAVGAWAGLTAGGPSLLEVDGELRLWFHAHGEEGTRIAAARSADGLTWTMESDEPVLDVGEEGAWDDTAVAHPSVRERGGIYEMWYASDELAVGHALSEDGVHWTRYCNNPVFEATGEATWEHGQTKAPEVIVVDGVYHLFYSAGGQESWRVGHAASADGLRWVRSSEAPLLAVGEPGSWEEQGTINAAPLLEHGTLRLWYTGISSGPSATGMATVVDWE